MSDYDLEGDYADGYKHLRHVKLGTYVGIMVGWDDRTNLYWVTTRHNPRRKYEQIGPEVATEEEAFAFAVALARFNQ